MPKYRVKQGQTLPHGGEILEAGAVVELDRAVAEDTFIIGRVEPLDDFGNPIEVATEDALASELAKALKHEHISILKNERERVANRLAQLDEMIAAEERDLSPEE